MLVAMSAPSGAGKDAVRELLIDWGVPAHFAVTATTRPKRPDECRA
jgi:guanylate kinase